MPPRPASATVWLQARRKLEQPVFREADASRPVWNKETELDNRRMKQRRSENRHMYRRLTVSHRNRFEWRRQLGKQRRNREPLGDREGESIGHFYRIQECHGYAEHLHDDTEGEQHDHGEAGFAMAAFREAYVALLRHSPNTTQLSTSVTTGAVQTR